jgi:gliding motility-associated-like protein
LGNELLAAFNAENMICPQDAAMFTDSSKGNIAAYYWTFGNGNTSIAQNPPPQYYPRTGAETKYTVQLVVQSGEQCYDTASSVITVLKSCFIAVPNAFTPNNDGNNDYLYPLNALKADNLDFKVYNRFGQLVFHTTDRTAKWDGKINGRLQDTGVYVWMLNYTDHDTGKKVMQKGTTVLIR